MNRFLLSLFVFCFAFCIVCAQDKTETPDKKPVIEYKTTIYTDKTLSQELVNNERGGERSFGSELLISMGNAAIGAATGYVSSIVDLGIQALGKLIMLDRQHKKEWQETITQESTVTNNIGTLYALNDFYAKGSFNGALDPTDIQFNGIGCLATTDEDTAFYVSCHLNRAKLNRLRDHSKFELILDTLVLDPYRAHLPNTPLPLPFKFSERKAFDFKIKIQLISSWLDMIPSMHKDVVLGEFMLDVPIDSTDVNKQGKFVYIRKPHEPAKYDIMGESFIVPRSFMPIINENGSVSEYYGTGQYSLNISITETCDVTPEFQKNWRKDRKNRKSLQKAQRKKPTFDDVCKTVSHQTWDESLQAWVITILKAPASYSFKTLNEKIMLPSGQQQQQQKQP